MKILTVKNALKALAALPLIAGSSAFATAITVPLHLGDADIIGTIDPAAPPGDNLANNITLVNNLLSLTSADTLPSTKFGDGKTYATTPANADFFSGSLTGVPNSGSSALGASIPDGYNVIVAKYANEFVVFYNADAKATTLPTLGSDLVVNGNFEGQQLSGARAFNVPIDQLIPPNGGPGTPTPDGGATMLLLGGGVTALACLRRKLS